MAELPKDENPENGKKDGENPLPPAPAADPQAPATPESPAAGEPDKPHVYSLGETFRAVHRHLSQDERWARLNWFQRRKLETSYTLGLLAQSSLRDLGDMPLLNAVVTAVPGPWGVPVGAGIAVSYIFRWDKRGKEVRAKLLQMAREGVPLHEYEDVLVPHARKPGHERINDGALIAKQTKMLKDETVDSYAKLFSAAVKTYIAGRDFAGEQTSAVMRIGLKPIVGNEKADEIVKDAGKAYETGETAVTGVFNTGAKAVRGAADATWNFLGCSWRCAVSAGTTVKTAAKKGLEKLGL